MALLKMNFTFAGNPAYPVPANWSHTGVVGSGDMEILIDPQAQNGQVDILVQTPVTGFDTVWEKVLGKFVEESGIGNLSLEINDNNATPFIATLRLRQAIDELEGKA